MDSGQALVKREVVKLQEGDSTTITPQITLGNPVPLVRSLNTKLFAYHLKILSLVSQLIPKQFTEFGNLLN